MKLNKDELYKSMDVHNFNLSKLAKEMGVSRSTLHKVLTEQREPGNKFYDGIKKVFGREQAIKILQI